jgi:hypothetical protein
MRIRPTGERPSTTTEPSIVAPGLALVLGLAVAVSGWRGTDWPAHLFRISLFEDVGLTLWNGQWYGGHYALGYSVLLPPLASWLGPLPVGIASGVAATACLAALLRPRYGTIGTIAASWFAVATAVNLVVGRLPFALGIAVGLGALVALDRGRLALAVVLALTTPLASPVAGLFLGLVAVGLASARWLDRPRRDGVGAPFLMAAASALPIVASALLFPDGGQFPFRGAAFVAMLATCLGLAASLPRGERIVRTTTIVVAIAALPLFVFANPMGGNVTRIVVFFAVPTLIVANWRHRPALVVAGAVPLTIWLLLPLASGTSETAVDSAATPAYHAPLVDLVTSARGLQGRVEIPFTAGHWEVAFVAPTVPIARGWERQVDMDRNAVLYSPDLTAAEYRDWIDANAVRWIAIPGVPLDEGGVAEAALVRRGLPWLSDGVRVGDWTVYEVDDPQPIVEPPARLVREGPDEIVIRVDEASTVSVRAWYMPYWTTSGAAACVSPSDDGHLDVTVSEPGEVVLQPSFSLDPLLTDEGVDDCASTGSVGERRFDVGEHVARRLEAH